MALFDQLSIEQAAVLTILGVSLAYLFLVDPLWDRLVRARQRRPIARAVARALRVLETRTSMDAAVPRIPPEPAVHALSHDLEGMGFDRGGHAEARRRTRGDASGQPYRGGDAA